jgi:hypothetical protein
MHVILNKRNHISLYYILQVDVFYPNDEQSAAVGHTRQPTDGFIVISLAGVNIRENDGKVPCRLNFRNTTVWNRDTELDETRLIDRNPIFSEFGFLSDIELVRNEVSANFNLWYQ